jgi:signal peptidase I
LRQREEPRAVWTTCLVSFFLGPVAGFLWIGRGRLGLLALIVLLCAILYVLFFSLPLLPQLPMATDSLASFLGILFSIVSVLIVLPFRKGSLPRQWYSHGLSVLLLAGILPYLAVAGTRSFWIQPYSVPTVSMAPNLVVGDYFWVSKLAYGYSRFSTPFDLLPIEGRLFAKQPGRGDIVVFRLPAGPNVDCVMRLVGLPGETIQMAGRVLHIDRIPVRLETVGAYNSSDGAEGELQRETLPMSPISFSIPTMVAQATTRGCSGYRMATISC